MSLCSGCRSQHPKFSIVTPFSVSAAAASVGQTTTGLCISRSFSAPGLSWLRAVPSAPARVPRSQ